MKINEAVKNRIKGGEAPRMYKFDKSVVAKNPLYAKDEEDMDKFADEFEKVTDDRYKDADGIVPTEKDMKATLSESLFEDYEETENEDKDVYTYCREELIADGVEDGRFAVASDINDMEDYAIGVYCKTQDGVEKIRDLGENLYFVTDIVRTKNANAKQYPFIHILHIPDDIAQKSIKEYKELIQ